jgi:hypothetical protein
MKNKGDRSLPNSLNNKFKILSKRKMLFQELKVLQIGWKDYKEISHKILFDLNKNWRMILIWFLQENQSLNQLIELTHLQEVRQVKEVINLTILIGSNPRYLRL